VVLAAGEGDEVSQERKRIDPIGLQATRPTIDLDAWRI
jgi:hypothetical protein